MTRFLMRPTSADLGKSLMPIEVVLILLVAYSLFYRVLLPYAYIFGALSLAAIVSILVLKCDKMHNLVIVGILLVYMLVRNVYYLATQNIIPFGDAVWDYGVVRTFLAENHIFVISGVARPIEQPNAGTLTWYSGWPLLHTLGAMLCRVTGIDPFYLFIIVPIILSVGLFAFVYVFLEKVRSTFRFGKWLTIWGLLIFTTSPDSIYYPMQFVRQNLAMFFFFVIIYLLYSMVTHPSDRRLKVMMILFSLALVIAHNWTSLTMLVSLILLYAIWTAANYFARHNVGNRIILPFNKLSLLGLVLVTTAFLFLWVNNFGSIAYPSVTNRLDRFARIITGGLQLEYFSMAATYPESLTPLWAVWLLRVRDLVIYAPVLLGVFVLWVKKKAPERSFLVYFALILGFLLAVYNVLFKLEPFRVIMLALPIIAALVPIGYGQLRSFATSNLGNGLLAVIVNKLRMASPAAIIVLLVFSSFAGLWGHSFAPIHLYDPNVSSIQVGERNVDPLLGSGFFDRRVPVDNYRLVYADDIDQLVFLLKSTQYDKIRRLPEGGPQELAEGGDQLVMSFRDFYMYIYYGNIYTPIATPNDARTIQVTFTQYMNGHSNRFYDDGIATAQTLSGTNQTISGH